MRVTINDSVTEVPDGLTIEELLTHQKVKMPEMVSVQINGTILKREEFATTRVHENDSVDFLYFMGGGGRASAAAAETIGKEWMMA